MATSKRVAPHRLRRATTGSTALLGLVLLAGSPAPAETNGVGADQADVGGPPAKLARGSHSGRLLFTIDETLPHLRGSDRNPVRAVAGSGAAASTSTPAPTRADTIDFGFYEIRDDG